MLSLLKAEWRKLRRNTAFLILLVLSIVVPIFTNTVLFVGLKLLEGGAGEDIPFVINVLYAYSSSFSPLNNLGLFMFIFIVIIGANDFSQFTIRNKVIAGHKRSHIFFTALIMNLSIMFMMTLITTTIGYLFASFFQGFDGDTFIDVFRFGVIGYSSLAVLYTLITVLLFQYKNVAGPLLVTLGSFFLILIINGLIESLFMLNGQEFKLLYYAFPIVRLNIGFGTSTTEWYWALLANLGHLAWLIPLGNYIANKTDFK